MSENIRDPYIGHCKKVTLQLHVILLPCGWSLEGLTIAHNKRKKKSSPNVESFHNCFSWMYWNISFIWNKSKIEVLQNGKSTLLWECVANVSYQFHVYCLQIPFHYWDQQGTAALPKSKKLLLGPYHSGELMGRARMIEPNLRQTGHGLWDGWTWFSHPNNDIFSLLIFLSTTLLMEKYCLSLPERYFCDSALCKLLYITWTGIQ